MALLDGKHKSCNCCLKHHFNPSNIRESNDSSEMRESRSTYTVSFAIFFAGICVIATLTGAAAEPGTLLTGKAAMGDWTRDAPGVRRKIAVNDLPAPSSNVFAINRARVVDRPANAQPQVPPGFKIELYASGFRDPRFLRTAPNGDIFVVES